MIDITAAAASRIVTLAATICIASMSHAQSGQSKGTVAILPDVALLIRGPFGEYSYKLTRTADDSVTLEEFGGRHMRLANILVTYPGGGAGGLGIISAAGRYRDRISRLDARPSALQANVTQRSLQVCTDRYIIDRSVQETYT